MSYIDGLASGLNTTEIIKAMMDVEAIPKTLLENKVKTVKQGLDAFASIRAKTSPIRTAATDLAAPAAWRALSATSSNPDAVSVSAGTGTPGGSISFSVTQLAKSMVQTNADTFGTADADLGGRTLTIDSGAVTFNSTATSLDALVAEINDTDGLGVKASTIQVRPNEYQLVLKAEATGVDNGFTVGGTGWVEPFAVTTAAQNAVLDVGGIEVQRATNTIDDLVPGATINLKAETTSSVTVNVERDVAGITEKVKELVDAVNAGLAEIKLRTGYDPETNQRSSLTGDATARTLAQKLTNALSGAVAGNDLGSVGLAGVELTREGTFTFDEAKFAAAYANDPASVEALFTPTGSASAGITYESAAWRAQGGTHNIELRNDAGTWSARIGGHDADVTVNDDGTLRLAVSSTNEAMGGMAVTVSEDIANAATAAFDIVGDVTYTPGAARRLQTESNRALDAINGTLTSAEDNRTNRIKDMNTQLEAWDVRLEKRELRLRQQYTALESLMGQLGNQSTWLSGQLAGLQGNSSNQ